MPQRKTAQKELRKNKKRQIKNLQIKHKIKSVLKKFKKSLQDKDQSLRQQALKEVCKVLDKAAAKNVIHPNKSARKKSRLSKLLKKSS